MDICWFCYQLQSPLVGAHPSFPLENHSSLSHCCLADLRELCQGSSYDLGLFISHSCHLVLGKFPRPGQYSPPGSVQNRQDVRLELLVALSALSLGKVKKDSL